MKTKVLGFGRLAVALSLLGMALGCGSQVKQSSNDSGPSDSHVVTSADPMTDKTLKLDGESVRFIANARLAEGLENGTLLKADSVAGQAALAALASQSGSQMAALQKRFDRRDDQDHSTAQTLTMGFPSSLLNHGFMFGAVITKISAHDDESLGNLKLTDLPPFTVKPALATQQGQTFLVLQGCQSDCTATSAAENLVALPVTAVDQARGQIMINITALGEGLNLLAMMDPEGSFTHLTERSSKATWADFSQDTLLFDVESIMQHNDDTSLPDVSVSVRWYLRPETVTHAQFASRTPTDGIGFFGTSSAATEQITRWARTSEGGSTIKYYVKGVPAEYQNDFMAVFSNWNTAMQDWGIDVRLEGELIPSGDPRNEQIIAGDIRYNVIEWDLVNKATYGGLGPSIAHQLTGETVAANVLIQGPEIINIYNRWFRASQSATDLRAIGRFEEADTVMRDAQNEIDMRSAKAKQKPVSRSLTMGQGLAFRINADRPQLQDDTRIEFENWPATFTFASYMSGYWLDTVGHEVGHNLGLRHNFKGNFGGSATPQLRHVSRSIMEYLPITHRYLDFVGDYDKQALQYGYMGQQPANRDWFCTDEGKVTLDQPTNSAECTTDDANTDAFLYFETKLNRAIDFMLAPETTTAPTWNIANLASQVDKASLGLLAYASSAAATSSTWTNWSVDHPERPTAPAAIKTFVIGRVKSVLCDARINNAINQKQGTAAKNAAKKNITDLRAQVKKTFIALQLGNGSAIACSN